MSKAREIAGLAAARGGSLRRLVEEVDISGEPDAGGLVRQIVTDLLRATSLSAGEMNVRAIGNTAVGVVYLGAAEEDPAGFVKNFPCPLKVEVGASDVVFVVAGDRVGACARDLSDYPPLQLVVTNAMREAMRWRRIQMGGRDAERPVGGPY